MKSITKEGMCVSLPVAPQEADPRAELEPVDEITWARVSTCTVATLIL